MQTALNRFARGKKVQAILLFLFAFLLPSQLGKHFFLPFSFVTGVRVDYLAPTLYLTDILAVLLFVTNIRLFAPLLKRRRTLLIVLLAALFNFAFALSPPLFLYRFAKLAEAAALFFIFARRYPAYKKQIVSGLAFATAVQAVLVFGQLASRHALQGVWYFLGERMFSLSTPGIAKASLDGRELLRPYGTFSHPNSLAGFFLLTGLFFLMSRDITSLILKYAVVLLATLLILVSFSKNAILVFLFLSLLYAWRTGGCRLCRAAKILTALAAASLFLGAQTDIQSFDKRLTLIGQSLAVIGRYPVTGTGLGSYLHAQAVFPIKYPYFFLQPVHNIFLLFTAEAGLPLAAGAAFFLFRFFRRPHPSLFLYLSAAVFLTGLSDHYWLMLQQNLLIAAVLLGIVYNKQHGTR